MDKVKFEVGELVTPAKVNEDGTITPAVRKGTTPLSPFLLNQIQENIEKDQTRQDNEMTNTQNKIIKVLQEVETPTPVSGTSIDISDSAEAKITELNISGNSRQETRSGKNYLNMFTKYKAGDTTTINGVKFTFNKDGSITCDGTASTDANLDFSIPDGGQKISGTNKKMVALIDGDYTNSGKAIAFIVYDKDWANNKNIPISTINKNISQVMVDNIEYSRFRVIVYKDTVINNRTLYLQVLDTSQEDLSYEQYGLMPSSDYPSEVESCGDNINMFDKDNVNILNNMFLNTTNKNIVTYSKRKCFYLQIKPNTTYTISGNYYSYGTTEEIPDSNSNLINVGWTTPATFISSSNVKYLVVYYLNENDILTEQEILDSIKIEKGSKATPYSPYGQGCINEVICSEDLLKETSWKKNYILNSNNEEEKIDGWYLSDYIDISEGDYIYTSKNSGVKPKNILYDKNKNVIGLFNVEARETSLTQYNAKYIRLSVNEIGKEKNTLCKKQTYTIPTQQPFRAIGDTRDTFIKKNNKWYERHLVEEVSLKYARVKGNNCYYYVGDKQTNIKKPSSNNEIVSWIKCNIAKGNVSANYLANNDVIGISIAVDGNIGLNFSNESNLTTIELATQFLEQNDVYAYFEMETPLDIECTEEQSEILWDIEQNAKTYDKVTHIYSTDEVSPNVEVTYKKDIETLFANTLVESGV